MPELITTDNPEAQQLTEGTGFGELVPLSEYPQFDREFGGGGLAFPYSRLDDRQDGRFLPYYQDEHDLARIRGQARNLSTFTATSIGALESLTNYVIGSGPTFKAQTEVKEADQLVLAVQRFLDSFLEENNFIGGVDREIHNRSREDGEAFVVLHRGRSTPRICILEPDQVTEPDNPRQLNDWLGADAFASFWSFGVHTRMSDHLGCQDFANPLGYHVVYDGTGNAWDYIPATRVDAQVRLPTDAVMEHLKRNTSGNAKRGVSDFYAIQHKVVLEAKVEKNTAEGAAIQAAIALITEHLPGTTASEAAAMVSANSITDYQEATKSGTRTVKVRQWHSGTQLDMPAGKKYHAGPLGSLDSPIFIEVAQMLLRAIGRRWLMPEYMVSGDASNANFSSTLVAESPFVKSREADQVYYIRHFKSIAWKAIRLAWEEGRFDKWVKRWSELRQLIDLDVTLPGVASRNRQEQAGVNEIERRNGILSQRTWAAETGRDFDAEQENMRAAPAPPISGENMEPADGLSPAGRGALQAAFESVETTSEARAVLEDAYRGGYP